VNSRFDVIGGALYFLLVVSVLPRCSGVGEVLDAHSVGEVLRLFFTAAMNTVMEIFSRSYVSLAALGLIFAVTLGFAKSGGVGAIDGRFDKEWYKSITISYSFVYIIRFV